MKASRNVLAALSVLGAAGVVFAVLFFGRGSGAKNEALEARRAAMRRLGEHIRSARPGENVLVLGNPFVERQGASAEIRRYQRAGVEGLITGLEGSADVEVVFPELSSRYLERPESVVIPLTSRTPLKVLMTTSKKQNENTTVTRASMPIPNHMMIIGTKAETGVTKNAEM